VLSAEPCGLLEIVRRKIEEGEVRALLGKLQRGYTPDAAARAGHHYGFIA
jgi:hypothetical protein